MEEIKIKYNSKIFTARWFDGGRMGRKRLEIYDENMKKIHSSKCSYGTYLFHVDEPSTYKSILSEIYEPKEVDDKITFINLDKQ